jgi:hypothetical protein
LPIFSDFCVRLLGAVRKFERLIVQKWILSELWPKTKMSFSSDVYFRNKLKSIVHFVVVVLLLRCVLWPWPRALAEKQVFVSRPWKLVQTIGLLKSFKMGYRTRFIPNFWQSYGHLKMWIFPCKLNFHSARKYWKSSTANGKTTLTTPKCSYDKMPRNQKKKNDNWPPTNDE